MKKKIAILVVLVSVMQILLCACAGTGSGKNDGNTVDALENYAFIRVSSEKIYPDGEKSKTDYLYDENYNYIGTDSVGGTKYRYDGSNNLIEEKYLSFDGKNKKIIVYDSDGSVLENKEYTKDGLPYRFYFWDENENPLKEEYYEDGELDFYISYSYNADGKKTQKAFYTPQGEKKDTWELYFYDDNGDMVKSEYYSKNELLTYNTYTYDAKHNMLTDTYCYADGREEHHYTFIYDDNGNKIEQRCTDKEGMIKWIWEYDDNGNLLEERSYLKDGSEDSLELHYYDDAGREIEYKDTYRGEVERHYKYTYDNNGNILTYWSYYKLYAYENYSYECCYDDNGNIVEYIHFDAAGNEEYRNQYTHDESGNRTKMVNYKAGEEQYRYVYTYEKIQVNPEDAERILEQQEQL